MDYEVKIARLSNIPIIKNLLQPYLEELSQYEPCTKNKKGEYEYKYLDQYWSNETRFPFLLYYKGEIAGFAFVRIVDGTYSVAEFYIKPQLRLRGIGFTCAQDIIERFKGNWFIEFYKENTARLFWRKVAETQTAGNIEEHESSETHDCLEFSNIK